jgi:hypothetical protein
VFLEKDYDLASYDEARFLSSLGLFHRWLRSLGLTLAPSTILVRHSEGRCYLRILQPFLGSDAEVVFVENPTQIHRTLFALQRLLAVADAIDGSQPFRLELKLRDFCWYRGELTLVDILPPVMAGHRRAVSVATPHDAISILGERERAEVLDITGHAVGVGRNLLEHAQAAGLPPEALDVCMERLRPSFRERLHEYLVTSGSATKVTTLMRRKESRC